MSGRPFASAVDLTSIDDVTRDRFWSKVDIRSADECWEWQAFRTQHGYGRFTLPGDVSIQASRMSLAMVRPLAQGEVACHRCDNPPCVNPGHLFAGTQSVNALDSVAKGRARRATGERNASAKLTDEQVRAIRTAPHYWGIYSELGRLYGVADNTIRYIRTGRKWRHVA